MYVFGDRNPNIRVSVRRTQPTRVRRTSQTACKLWAHAIIHTSYSFRPTVRPTGGNRVYFALLLRREFLPSHRFFGRTLIVCKLIVISVTLSIKLRCHYFFFSSLCLCHRNREERAKKRKNEKTSFYRLFALRRTNFIRRCLAPAHQQPSFHIIFESDLAP